jgi:hypothetical protein
MGDSNETKQETVRIAVPLPPAKPLGAGNESRDAARIVDAIPMPLCWTLLGVSTVILIIQIWTYFS